MRSFIPAAWVAVVIFAAMAAAQDVTVAPLAWMEPDGAPQELPVRKGGLKVEFPKDLRKTPEVGWASFEIWLDGEGEVRSASARGSQPRYVEALQNAWRRGGFKPARREGAPVSSCVRQTAVFNPASADPKARDATARLLDAGVIIDPAWTAGERKNRNEMQRTGWAEVQLDERGGVVAVTGGDAGDERLVRAGVARWTFAPARRDGRVVASRLRVPYVIVPALDGDGKDRKPPRILWRPEPVYPPAMRMSGLRGDVLVEFVVDREGRVQNAFVVRTLNPAFDQPALDAVRRFKFEPARVDGRAVACRMQQPISFSLDQPGGGDDGMEVRRRGDTAQLPPELRYDTEPKLRARVQPVYPYALLRERVKGEATVKLLIGPDGKVVSSRVAKADRPELGLALQAAAEGFEYFPALKDGKPTLSLIAFEQPFRWTRDGLVSEDDQSALALEQKHPERILRGKQLDRKLRPTLTRPAAFPKAAEAEKLDHGSATVEFLVDEAGAVRLPRATAASDPVFGYAAVQAVAGWQFEPPMSGGKPGVVRVEVPFEFTRPPAGMAEAGAEGTGTKAAQ